jgi:hypothetical protein
LQSAFSVILRIVRTAVHSDSGANTSGDRCSPS